jgi:hypothetical protein
MMVVYMLQGLGMKTLWKEVSSQAMWKAFAPLESSQKIKSNPLQQAFRAFVNFLFHLTKHIPFFFF